MDRGVKIAIFVASIASLGLGLIWDQVLSQARVVVESDSSDGMGPERIEARVGSPGIERADDALFPIDEAAAPAEALPQAPSGEPKAEAAAPNAVDQGWADYTLKNGESPWIVANKRFKERGLSSSDLQKANPGSKWRAGDVIRIPPQGWKP